MRRNVSVSACFSWYFELGMILLVHYSVHNLCAAAFVGPIPSRVVEERVELVTASLRHSCAETASI